LLEEESEWVKLIALMRVDGIQINPQAVKAILAEKKKEHTELLKELMSYGINGPNHRTSIARWVATLGQTSKLKITEKGNPSYDEESLGRLTGEAVPIVKLILEARRIEKEISTWIEAPLDHADQAGRIHPSFMVSGAKSNRLTCKNPSAHTFPKSMEDVLFTARPGYRLVVKDYKAAELRIAASFANERVLVDEFQKENADPHMATARLIFGPQATEEDRRKAKNATFSRNYGAGVRKFVDTCNKGRKTKDQISLEKGEEIYQAHKAKMSGITRTSKQAERTWKIRGYLKVLGGKRVYASKEDLERAYKAFNYLIQPSVAELIKKAMIRIKREVDGVILVSQKHDSIAMELPDDETLDAKLAQIDAIMVGEYPQYMRDMTEPPVLMAVDLEANRPGLPYPTET
jgi:DNA polymerase-1